MSDLLFIKQLNGTPLWLGLRLPSSVTVNYDADGTAKVGTDWSYEEQTLLPDGIDQVWIPMLDPDANGSQMPFTWKGVDISENRNAPYPFRHFEDEAGKNNQTLRNLLGKTNDVSIDEKDLKEQFQNQIDTLRKSPSVILRALQAYRELEPGDLGQRHVNAQNKTADEPGSALLASLHEAMGGQANSINIDLFSGLIFVANGTPAAPASDSQKVFIDPTPKSPPSALTLAARQDEGRVLLRASNDGSLLTNRSILGLFNGGHSPYYRLYRGQGVEGRAAWRSPLIVIPTNPPEALRGHDLEPLERPWDERPFHVVNPVGAELVGELLNYRLELFNLHGRRQYVGRVLVMRQDVSPPAAPTRGSARLSVTQDGKPKCEHMEIRMDFAPAERAALEKRDESLQVVVYALSSPRIPTGFYGDADDSALAIGRILSDLDPAAVLSSGAASAELDTGVRELADARLSSQGLAEIKSLAPTQRKDVKRANTAAERADHDADEFMVWALWLELKEFSKHLQDRRSMRLFLALRRQPPGNDFAGAQRTLESAVIPVDMCIVDASGTIIQSVQHFEDFWTQDDSEVLRGDERDARIYRAPNADPLSQSAGITGSLKVQIDHGFVVNKSPEVGGYRLWMREAAGTQSPWRPLAVVQVVPPLVKAYAPIETGRLWIIAEKSEEDATSNKPNVDNKSRHLFRTDGQLAEVKKANPDATENEQIKAKGKALLERFKKLAIEENGTALLDCIKDLGSEGFAAEYLLSVSQRRRLERQNLKILQGDDEPPAASPGDGLPDGNWLLLKDQNGHYLGRAWAFWGEAVPELKKRYTLVEVPNAQDTVGTDDFGKATWTWHGLTDHWGHDFEWVVEPLSRYAPILQRISAQTTKGNEASTEGADDPQPRADRYTRGLLPLTPDAAAPPDRHFVHKLRVQRTAPLTGRFGVVQPVLDPNPDAFVFRVYPPEEFRVAAFNSVARSAFGVHKMRVRASRRFIYSDEYGELINEKDQILLRSWIGESTVSTVEDKGLQFLDRAVTDQDLQDLPFFGDLVIDEPPCLEIELTLQAVADGVVATKEHPETKERTPALTKVRGARRQAMVFTHPDKVGGTLANDQLRIPLARLSWSYKGESKPPLSLLPGVHKDLANRHLLELPDPLARVDVFRRDDAKSSFVLVASFSGSKAPKADGLDNVQAVPVPWGALFRRNGVFADGADKQDPLNANTGDLTLGFAAEVDSGNLLVIWRREASQLTLGVIRTNEP